MHIKIHSCITPVAKIIKNLNFGEIFLILRSSGKQTKWVLKSPKSFIFNLVAAFGTYSLIAVLCENFWMSLFALQEILITQSLPGSGAWPLEPWPLGSGARCQHSPRGQGSCFRGYRGLTPIEKNKGYSKLSLGKRWNVRWETPINQFAFFRYRSFFL